MKLSKDELLADIELHVLEYSGLRSHPYCLLAYQSQGSSSGRVGTDMFARTMARPECLLPSTVANIVVEFPASRAPLNIGIHIPLHT